MVKLETEHAAVRLFSLLSDSTRIRLLLMLQASPMNVSSLTRGLSLPQPSVSHHLKLLRDGGIVLAQRHGKERIYRLQHSPELSLVLSVAKAIK